MTNGNHSPDECTTRELENKVKSNDQLESTVSVNNHQYSTESIDKDSADIQKLFLDFFDTLGLQNKYPQQLTLLDALQIRQELIGDIVASEHLHHCHI